VELGNIVDQLSDQDGFTNTGTGEQTSFTTFGQRCDQVDNLDSSFQNLRLVRLLAQIRSRAVNWCGFTLWLWFLVNRFTNHVKHASLSLGAHWHRNRRTSRHHFRTASQPISRRQRNRSHRVLIEVLCYFQYQRLFAIFNMQRVINRRQLNIARKLHIDHHANDLNNFS